MHPLAHPHYLLHLHFIYQCNVGCSSLKDALTHHWCQGELIWCLRPGSAYFLHIHKPYKNIHRPHKNIFTSRSHIQRSAIHWSRDETLPGEPSKRVWCWLQVFAQSAQKLLVSFIVQYMCFSLAAVYHFKGSSSALYHSYSHNITLVNRAQN